MKPSRHSSAARVAASPAPLAQAGRTVRAVRAGGLALAAALLAACGSGGGDKPASQVAAKVNQEEISVHQINYVMQRQPGLKPEQAEAGSRQILERLIDQELAVQKAQELKLDRDPQAVQAIEAARREILARMYLERTVEGVQPPTPEEVRAYYEDKPELFSQRRIYELREYVIDVPAERVPALQERLAASKSADEFVAWLKTQELRHTTGQVTRAAEQLPLPLLQSLHKLERGGSMLQPGPAGAQLVVVNGWRDSPVGLEQARPAIEQFLANDRRRQMAEQNIKAIREQAQIEYVGQFAEAAPTADAAGRPAGAAAPAAAASAGGGQGGNGAGQGAGQDAAAINKGLSGLK